ncbi:hypothetical protein D018_1705B, partial [Vibrio parahaemolyticus VP2007-007]
EQSIDRINRLLSH